VTIQYNLSLDNEGGFVEILGDCVNSIYRYNVSINDGSRAKGVHGATQDGHLTCLSLGITGTYVPEAPRLALCRVSRGKRLTPLPKARIPCHSA
jgi:hypothetical protein